MPYIYGILVVVLLFILFFLFRITLKGGMLYHNIMAVAVMIIAFLLGFYLISFLFELGEVFIE